MNAKNMYLLFLIISSILFISISSSVNAVGTCTGSCESGSQCNVYGNPNPGKVWSCKNTGSYYECIQTSADNCDYLDCSLGWRDCGCDVSGCEQRCESQYANQPGYHTRTEFCDDCGQKFTCDCYIQEVPNLFCGDGAINQYWEKCDLNGDNGRDKNNDGVFGPGECRTDCTYCGDADTQFYTEACDYKDTIYKNCATFPNDPNCCRDNSYGRNMCTYCGDGKVQTGLEECEYKSHCTAITGKILLSCNSDCVCVYEDAFGCIDGYKRDTTGIGLPLWEITTEYVNDPSIRYIAYTDSSGYYKFPQLIIGTWKVTETMKSGWAVASGYSISYNKYVSVGSTCAVANFKNKQVPTLGCVEGIKRDDNHIGLSGWTIHAKKVGQPDSSGKTAVTGSDGSYKIEGLEPGNYEFWEDMKPGWEPVTAQRFIGTVVAGNTCTEANFKNKIIIVPGCIEGYKKDTSNRGLSQWTITATKTDDSSVRYSDVTDSSGYFRMSDVETGTYRITETMKSGWAVADGYSISYTRTVNPGNSCAQVTFKNKELPTEGCIEGYKKDTQNIGLPQWTITAVKNDDNSRVYSAVTDSAGHYIMNGVETGSYTVTETMKSGWAVASGYSISYNKYVSVGSICAVANFKNKQVPTLGCVEGIKRDDNHIGLSGWTIHAKKVGQPDSSGKTAVTGSDGSYKIEGLEPGNYEFWEDMKPGWEPVTAQRFIGTVVAGNSCTQANFKNKEIVIPGCIEGYKKDTENIGLPLWKITATRTDDSSVKYTAMTDSEGRYKMTGVQSGTYTITETMQSGWDVADGYSLSYTKTVNPGDSCTLVNFKNKQVPTEGCVEGIKRDDNHVGLSGWTIHAKKIGQPDSSGKTAVTGSDGSYKINGLEPGTYEFWEDMKTGWEPVTAQRFIGTVSAGNSCTQANFKNKVLCECDPSDVCCNEDCKYYPEGHQPDGMYDFEYDYCSMHDLMIKKVDYYCPGSSGDYEVKETNELKKDCTTLDNCESWNYFCKMDDSTREQTCHDFTCVETSTSVSCESESRTEKIVDECDNPFCEDDNYYCLENDVYKDRTCFTGGCNDETGRCKDVNPYEEDEFVEACGDDFCDDSNTELDIYIKEYIMDEDSCDNGQCMPDTGRSDDFCSDSSTLHQVTCNGLDKGPDDIVDCSSLTGCYAVPMEECFGSCSRYQHCNGGRCDYPTEMMVYKDFGCSNGACTYDEDDFVDTDTDYIDDRCDSCIDTDHDGICDDDDNCPTVWNSHQRDDDHDGLGDLCDTDVDGDGYLPPEDCNDYDPEVNPGMDEIPYNGQDDDCSDETEDMPGSVPKQTAFVDLTILNEERLVPGDIMEVFIEVNNIGRYDQKGVSVNGYVTSYGIRARRDLGDLRKGKSKTTVLYIEIPENAKPGFNYLRVNINNDEFSRTIIREFWLNK